MSSYINAFDIDNGEKILLGTSLFGICYDGSDMIHKRIILPNLDNLTYGLTIGIKFTQGNIVTDSVTLQFFSDRLYNNALQEYAVNVQGTFICQANDVIAFTYEEQDNTRVWHVNNSIEIRESATRGYLTVNGRNVKIHGLGTAAYADVEDLLINAPEDLIRATGGTFRGNVNFAENANLSINPPTADSHAATKKYVDDHIPATSTGNASHISEFEQNTLPTLTITPTNVSQVSVSEGSNAATLETTTYTINNVTQAGTATTAQVVHGVLQITTGTNTIMSSSPITVKSVDTFSAEKLPVVAVNNVDVGSASGWTPGTQANLSKTDLTVMTPANNN